MVLPLKWEDIDEDISRAPVQGGWLVKNMDNEALAKTLVFIPDPGHEWQCDPYE